MPYRDPDLPSHEAIAVRDGLRLFFDAPERIDDALTTAFAAARIRSRPINAIEPALVDEYDAGALLGMGGQQGQSNDQMLARWRKETEKRLRKAARELKERDPRLYAAALSGAVVFTEAFAQVGVEFEWCGPPFVRIPSTFTGAGVRTVVRYRIADLRRWAEDAPVPLLAELGEEAEQ